MLGKTYDERDARILLALMPEGPALFPRLLTAFGSMSAAWKARSSDWAEAVAGRPLPAKLSDSARTAAAKMDDERRLMEQSGVRVFTDLDDEFPAGLKRIDDPPPALFGRGRWKPLDDLSVAIVGTRGASAYGLAVAAALARDLAAAGVTVISGLARGIDTEAHNAALKAGGRTAAFLGSGFGDFYPSENKPLADRMAEQGGVWTEFPMATPPEKHNFPRRNRLVAGASLAVIVVEADAKSGALITARLAAQQGREVLAVPGSVFSKTSAGPHRLLRDGARLVGSAEDVIDAIPVFKDLARREKKKGGARRDLPPAESAAWKALSFEPASVDGVSASSGLAPAAAAAALVALELKGLARCLPGKTYVRASGGDD